MDALYKEFLAVAKHLNSNLEITPVLYGSLGLQVVSGLELHPQDIDVLVPSEYVQGKWELLKTNIELLGYILVDQYEHEFEKGGVKLAFAFEEDLLPFAGVDYRALEVTEREGVRYKRLTISDYLKVYRKSLNDGYRRTKNNSKDQRKIDLLEKLLEGEESIGGGVMESMIEKKIDSIFSLWTQGDCPGGQIAIRKKGEIIYRTNFGLANLEHRIPIEEDTIFHVASISKQITVMCVLLLQEDGKLSIDDDVRKYVPECIQFNEPVTLREMMNNISGIRDQWELLMISGVRIDDTITQTDALNMIGKQKELNFEPKSQYMYSNANFTLLAEIVERISGKSLNDFCKERIFSPLGMENTMFKDSYWKLIKNRANSYFDMGTGVFVNNVLNYGTYGATALNTTITDFLKWMDNYKEPKICSKETIETMFNAPKLRDGKTSPYAGGLFVGEHKGHKYIEHGGADAAYRAQMLRFVDDDIDIVIFSNTQNIMMKDAAFAIADIILGHDNDNGINEDSGKELTQENSKTTSNNEKDQSFQRYIKNFNASEAPGFYFGYTPDSAIISSTIVLKDGTPHSKGGYGETPLLHMQGNHYKIRITGVDLFLGNDPGLIIKNSYIPLRKLVPYSSADHEEMAYGGRYESKELDTYYDIIKEDGICYFRHHRNGKQKLYKVGEDKFVTDGMTFSIEFIKEADSVTGFKLSGGRVKNVRFTKVSGI